MNHRWQARRVRREVTAAVVFGLAMAAELRGQESIPAAPPPAPEVPLKNLDLGPGRLDVGASLRLRYEFADNVNVRGYGGGASDSLLLFRTRLNVEYRLPDDGPRARLELQDSRYTWSDLGPELWTRNSPYRDTFDVREAYVEWKGIGGSPLGFKAGRQAIKYGDRRVFGPGDWGNVGKFWWDAAKLYWETDRGQLDLVYGRRVTSRPTKPNTTHFPFEMYSAYFQGKAFKSGERSLKPDVFYVFKEDDSGTLKGEAGTGDERIHSAGFLVEGQWGPAWDFGGTLIGQTGRYGGDDVRAYGGNARAGHTWAAAPWTPRLAAEISYASGDRDPDDGRRGTFDGVFGDMALYYGRMNMFSLSNLVDYQLSFAIQPTPKVSISVDYHLFHRAQTRDEWYWVSGNPVDRDAGADGREIGQEVDLLAQWRVNPYLELSAGAARFFAGDFIDNTEGGSGHADWVFVQGTLAY